MTLLEFGEVTGAPNDISGFAVNIPICLKVTSTLQDSLYGLYELSRATGRDSQGRGDVSTV